MTEPSADFTPKPLDQDELDGRYIESRIIERGMIMNLGELLEATMKRDQRGLEFHKDQLKSDLRRRFNEWQFFYDGKLGLNSGGVGEAFTRLVGTGIMEDFPQLGALPQQTTDYGVSVVKRPRNAKDLAIIEVSTHVGLSEYQGCRFKFQTSLQNIRERMKVVGREIDEKREEYGNRMRQED